MTYSIPLWRLSLLYVAIVVCSIQKLSRLRFSTLAELFHAHMRMSSHIARHLSSDLSTQ